MVQESYHPILISFVEVTDYLKIMFCVWSHEKITLLNSVFKENFLQVDVEM